MRTAHPTRRRGFTLIELLTVIAIISLLIGVLVPAVSAAKNAAKRASTQNLIDKLGQGCGMFQRDFERYPRSSGLNPFEPNDPLVWLSGAQWLILELAGADLKGYAAGDQYRYPDVAPVGAPDTVIDFQDWLEYYSANPAGEYHRFGPYVQLDGKAAQSPQYYLDNTSASRSLPPALTQGNAAAGTSDWNNGRLPFAVDAFGFPVLYYVANDQASLPFSDPQDAGGVGNTMRPGRYTQWDNTPFTGSANGAITGIDLGGGTSHPLYWLGWSVTDPNRIDPAHPQSFAGVVYDRALFDQNRQADGTGKIWPHCPNTFIFISAGKDAMYGTSDDVMNFEN
jgi:prepilin-type N-terminal cleavage/methylation domain-containing protein